MRFTRTVWIVPLLAVLMVLGAATLFSPKNALAWNLEAHCSGQNNVVGTIDVPSNATSGLPFTVFVEWEDSGQGWHWVTNAGQNINGTGQQAFNMGVSSAPGDAQWLRVRYKDKNEVYGQETSALFRPCNFTAPAPTPLQLHVTDLQAECTNPSLHIVGGMIGVPSDAGGFPWTVFLEYQDPANVIPVEEDWHWVSGTGVKIGSELRGQMVNFEFNDSTTPSGVTELRVRYKSGESPPWIYGPEISRTFPPCGFPPPAPAPCNCPAPTPVPTQPPTTPCNCPVPTAQPPVYGPPAPDVNQTVNVTSTSGSGSTSTGGGSTSGGGGTSSSASGSACCSHGCCDGGDVSQTQTQDQHQSQTQTTGDVNVTVNGDSGSSGDNGNGSTASGNGDSDFWDWWWLIPAALIVLAIAALVGLFTRGRNNREETVREERTTRTRQVPPDNDPRT